jgi:tetratricopeptide (TPR) repeat protein
LFSPADATRLLRHRLGSARIDADPQAVHDITVACARLPLALSIVAARVAAHSRFPLAVLADQIRRAPSGLDAFDGADPATDVRAVLSWSYQTLSEPTARLFRLLGLHPGPDTDTAAAASLAGVPLRGTAAALAELTRAHLIGEHQPGRYLAHDLVRTYAAEQAERLDPDPDRAAALRRLLDHYLHSAHLADRLVNPHRDPVQPPAPLPGVVVAPLADAADALAWLAAEHAALVAAVAFAAAEGFDTHAWQLAWALTTYFDRTGLWRDRIEVQRTALAAAQRTGDPRAIAWADRNLARVYIRLGCPDDAERHLQHALLLNEQIGDRVGQARTHHNLARVAEDHDRPDAALRHAERALELFREADHPVGQADALNAVGWYEARRGALEEALEHCQQALALNRKTGDREGEAHTWDSLGYVNHELGAATPALDCYVRAVALWRELGDRYSEADTLVRLGDTHQAAGDPAAAWACRREAITLMEAYGHPDLGRIEAKMRSAPGLSPADGRQGQR